MKLFFGRGIAAMAALALVSSVMAVGPASAFDAPTLSGAYAVGGFGGVAAVIGKATEGADLNVTVKSLTGGDGGDALSAAIGKDTISFAKSGDGGAAGIDLKGADSSKIKLNAGHLAGGWAGSAAAFQADSLKVVIPDTLKVVID